MDEVGCLHLLACYTGGCKVVLDPQASQVEPTQELQKPCIEVLSSRDPAVPPVAQAAARRNDTYLPTVVSVRVAVRLGGDEGALAKIHRTETTSTLAPGGMPTTPRRDHPGPPPPSGPPSADKHPLAIVGASCAGMPATARVTPSSRAPGSADMRRRQPVCFPGVAVFHPVVGQRGPG